MHSLVDADLLLSPPSPPQDEIVKVQKRREERELDKVRQEEELQFLARERAIAEGAELDKKEELVSGYCGVVLSMLLPNIAAPTSCSFLRVNPCAIWQ
jgi:hypothetical protein